MSAKPHAHLIGICGTAMASLAGMLKQRGFLVTGSDNAVYPPMSDLLAELGISILQPYAESNLNPRPDLVIVGNAISRGNPELEHVLEQRIPMKSLPQMLAEEFLGNRETLVVAGTHGKTTTTSMLAWILHTAALQPSFLVGGVAENFASSFTVTSGKHFVLEGDEYDSAFFDKGPKFLHYRPASLLLTSVEFDHADIYANLEAVQTAFRRLVNLVPRNGRIVAWDGDETVSECLGGAFTPVERYGLQESSEWRVADLRLEPQRTSWSVLHRDRPWANLEFSLGGEYNVLNATGAAAMAAGCGVAPDVVSKALGSFRSVKRRLEVIAEVNGVTFVDDFAHHPTAIAGTLRALRERYPGTRLWAIFEPRSNTLRRKVFESDLARSLGVADLVVVAGVFRPDSVPEGDRLDPEAVVAQLNRTEPKARFLPEVDAIVAEVARELRPGDVVAILSNGAFGAIYKKLPQRFQSLAEVSTQA